MKKKRLTGFLARWFSETKQNPERLLTERMACPRPYCGCSAPKCKIRESLDYEECEIANRGPLL